jgi:hypothetical protein
MALSRALVVVACALCATLIACADKKEGASAGSGGSGSSGGYTICDGSSEQRLGVVSEGGQVDATFEFTNPYGHAFLFIDGNCHYYAGSSWLKGVVQGELTKQRAAEIAKSLKLGRVEALDYHDVESCPDAGVLWLKTRGGYVDCTCGCDAKAPAGVEDALAAAGMLQAELFESGEPLSGPVTLLAIVEDKPVSAAGLPAWPLIWPLSDIAMTWEAYTRKITPTTRLLTDADAEVARSLRAGALKNNPASDSVRATDLGKTYSLFMREELPDAVQRAIEQLLAR